MRKTFILTVFILGVVSANAQVVQQDSTLTKLAPADYLKMSKNQKIGGWVFLATSAVTGLSGLGMVVDEAANQLNDGGNDIVSGITGGQNQPNTYNKSRANVGLLLMSVGAVSMVTSIVLFTQSGRNKRKGMSVSYKPMRAPVMLHAGAVSMKQIPTVTVTLAL